MANIIASGITAVDSSTFALAAGEEANLYLTGSPGADASVAVYILAADASYTYLGQLTQNEKCRVLKGVGTYKVSRAATAGAAFGVDKN